MLDGVQRGSYRASQKPSNLLLPAGSTQNFALSESLTAVYLYNCRHLGASCVINFDLELAVHVSFGSTRPEKLFEWILNATW